MSKTCFVSIDVEEDFLDGKTTDSFRGVEQLEKLLPIWDKFRVKITLFCTGAVIVKYGSLLKKYTAKGHEIALHGFFDHVNAHRQAKEVRVQKISEHIKVFKEVLDFDPIGFRAVQNTIDSAVLEILVEAGLKYDSSVISNYPCCKKYVGYAGRSPVQPYYPATDSCLRSGKCRILEIPLNPLLGGVQLQGKWIRQLGSSVMKFLLLLKKPELLSLSFHSWDLLNESSIKNGGAQFVKNLTEILESLNRADYSFKTGKQIYEQTVF